MLQRGGRALGLRALKEAIAEQIAQTEQVLAYHFDPRRQVDRPDRAIKNRDLSALLEFYLERSERQGWCSRKPPMKRAASCDVSTRRPTAWTFTRSALVFDFSKTGTESPELENGIEFYRIGQDLIQQLVEVCGRRYRTVSMASTPEACQRRGRRNHARS